MYPLSILQHLENAVGYLLLNETDRDVTLAISQVITQLEQIEISRSQTSLVEEEEFVEEKYQATNAASNDSMKNNNKDAGILTISSRVGGVAVFSPASTPDLDIFPYQASIAENMYLSDSEASIVVPLQLRNWLRLN